MEHQKYRGVCFHSQQCVEKLLKALTVEKGKRPERTDDIVRLLDAVAADKWSLELPTDEATFLNSIHKGRYPTEEGLLPHGEPTEDDARRAFQTAERVMKRVRKLLDL